MAGAESLAALRYKQSMNEGRPDPVEGRREEVLAMLAQGPDIQYATTSDDQSEPDAVFVTLAFRGKGTCEPCVPKNRYEPFVLLDLIEKQPSENYPSACPERLRKLSTCESTSCS
jgi:hypothetical protein